MNFLAFALLGLSSLVVRFRLGSDQLCPRGHPARQPLIPRLARWLCWVAPMRQRGVPQYTLSLEASSVGVWLLTHDRDCDCLRTAVETSDPRF